MMMCSLTSFGPLSQDKNKSAGNRPQKALLEGYYSITSLNINPFYQNRSYLFKHASNREDNKGKGSERRDQRWQSTKNKLKNKVSYLAHDMQKYLIQYNHQKAYNLIKMIGKVLVTGATGYLASHVINELLQRGYEVVGTVRSLANKEKYAFLYELPHAKEKLEMREADLLNAESWDEALKGIVSILHVASPIPPGIPKHQDQLIKPAVEGTMNVVNAALKNKVKRVIFTSSCLTVMVRTDGKVANEDDWSQLELLHHYPKSKYLAEKAFWELGEKHKEEIDFVSILPSLVTGPAFAKHGNSSQAFVSEILNGGYPGIPTPATEYAAVDVRDVAIAQVNALEYPEAKGRRFIVSGYSILSSDVFEVVRSKYGHLGYNIPSNPIDAQGIKQSGHGPSQRVVGFLGKKFKVDNSRAIKELGMKYRGAEESILDQAARQIELGIVAKK